MPARRAASRRTSRILCATSDRADERRSGPAHSKLRFALIVIPSLPRCAQLCVQSVYVSTRSTVCVGLTLRSQVTPIYLSIESQRTYLLLPCFTLRRCETARLRGCRARGERPRHPSPLAAAGAGGVYAGAARGPRREAEGRCYNSRLQHCLSSLSLSRAVADSALRSTCSRYGTNERRARTIQSTQTSTRRVKNPVTRLGTRVRRGACFLPPPSACLRA